MVLVVMVATRRAVSQGNANPNTRTNNKKQEEEHKRARHDNEQSIGPKVRQGSAGRLRSSCLRLESINYVQIERLPAAGDTGCWPMP